MSPIPTSLTVLAETGAMPWWVPCVLAVGLWLTWRGWQWRRLLARWEQQPNARLLTVSSVYQKASTGTKAVIRWERGGVQDAWFRGRRVTTGTHLLVFGGTGYGPHNDEPRVLYVDQVVASCGLSGPFAFGAARHGVRALRKTVRASAAAAARLHDVRERRRSG